MGVFTTLMGIMALVGVCVYVLFGMYNESNLEELNTAIQGPVTLPDAPAPDTQALGAVSPDVSFKPIEVVRKVQPVVVKEEPAVESAPAAKSSEPAAEVARSSVEAAPAQPAQSVETAKEDASAPQPAVEEPPAPEQSKESVSDADFDVGELVLAYSSVYPGYRIHPKYWDRPLTAGADDYTYGVIRREDGFVEVSSTNGLPRGTLSDATHIRIPSIGVDSAVTNLAILDLGDSKEYETPAHVVGRIPDTSNPGEMGNTWLFGHLESPIRGEGNVFRRLPEIPDILKNGDPVYVALLNEAGEEFMYQVTNTKVVHRDDLALYQTDDSTITLVTCVPRLIYDQRLVVSGKLVGIRKPA